LQELLKSLQWGLRLKLQIGAAAKDTSEGIEVPREKLADLAQLNQTRALLHRTYGQVILALASIPHYQTVPVSALEALILAPLMQDRLIIAKSPQNSNPGEDDGLMGIVIWATVSKAVDAKIREQIKVKRFPVMLELGDWQSGPIHWLLDVIAPNEAAAHQMISGLGNVIKGPQLRVHPAVQNLLKGLVPTAAAAS
jgi:cytolysin-activating lysine-acyltransferase